MIFSVESIISPVHRGINAYQVLLTHFKAIFIAPRALTSEIW